MAKVEKRVTENVLEFYSGVFKKVEGNRFPSWQGFREVAKPHRGKACGAPTLENKLMSPKWGVETKVPPGLEGLLGEAQCPSQG